MLKSSAKMRVIHKCNNRYVEIECDVLIWLDSMTTTVMNMSYNDGQSVKVTQQGIISKYT